LFIVSSTKLEISAEKILPGSEGEREGAEGRWEKWPKLFMHIGINE
jgi:hypothetical protein